MRVRDFVEQMRSRRVHRDIMKRDRLGAVNVAELEDLASEHAGFSRKHLLPGMVDFESTFW